jgi:hypothetical protein
VGRGILAILQARYFSKQKTPAIGAAPGRGHMEQYGMPADLGLNKNGATAV